MQPFFRCSFFSGSDYPTEGFICEGPFCGASAYLATSNTSSPTKNVDLGFITGQGTVHLGLPRGIPRGQSRRGLPDLSEYMGQGESQAFVWGVIGVIMSKLSEAKERVSRLEDFGVREIKLCSAISEYLGDTRKIDLFKGANPEMQMLKQRLRKVMD